MHLRDFTNKEQEALQVMSVPDKVRFLTEKLQTNNSKLSPSQINQNVLLILSEVLEKKINTFLLSHDAKSMQARPGIKELIREMLEIRIWELVHIHGVNEKEAISQAYNEQNTYRNTALANPTEFDILEEVKDELLGGYSAKHPSEPKPSELDVKKKEPAPETDTLKTTEQKKTDVTPETPQPRQAWTQPLAPYQTLSVNYGGGGMGKNPKPKDTRSKPPQIGKVEDKKNDVTSTTFNCEGLRVTVHACNVHRYVDVTLPEKPTDKQKQCFDRAAEAANKFCDEGYSLIGHNCVNAVSETLNAIDPSFPKTMLPWSLDYEVNKRCGNQLKMEAAAKTEKKQAAEGKIWPPQASGNPVNAQGKTTESPNSSDYKSKP